MTDTIERAQLRELASEFERLARAAANGARRLRDLIGDNGVPVIVRDDVVQAEADNQAERFETLRERVLETIHKLDGHISRR